MAKVRYALDPSDRATNKFLKSMEINIGPQSTETLDTHVQYLITDVELVPYFNMENVTLSSLPHYALNIYHKMEGFENAPGEVTQMLSQTEDKNWVNVRTRYENNQLEKHPTDGMVTYVLSDIEAKKAIDSGAYNDQQGFNTNLKQQLIGQSYTTTDRIKLITRQYVTPNHNMSLLPDSIALSKNAILIPSAMSSSKKFIFDQSQPQNFSQLLDTKLQNMIVVNREAQEEAHKQMVARQAQESERNHEVKHVVLDNTLDLGEPDYDETNQLDIEQQMTQEHNKDSEFDKQLKALNEEQVKQTAKEVIHDVSKQGADMYIDDDINNFALNEVNSSSSAESQAITMSKNADTTQSLSAVSSMSAIPASAEETNLFSKSQASPAVNQTNTDDWQPDTNDVNSTTSKTRKATSISSNFDSDSTAPKVSDSSKVTSIINDDNEYETSSVSSNPANDDMMAKLSALAKMAPDETQNDDDAFENLPISQQRQILRQQQQTMMQEEHQNDQTINQLNDETTDDDGWTFENQAADENRLTPKQKRQIKQSQQRQRKLLRQRQQQLDSPMLVDQKPVTKNVPSSSPTPKSQTSQAPTNDDDELAF